MELLLRFFDVGPAINEYIMHTNDDKPIQERCKYHRQEERSNRDSRACTRNCVPDSVLYRIIVAKRKLQQ